MPEIGATLREARMRERIDVSEIEAQTKIRAKYLRALENEEWDLLPGPTFVKSFLRTYAEALGLDGKALVEEYKLSHEHPEGDRFEPGQPPAVAARRARQRASGAQGRRGTGGSAAGGGPSRGYMIAVGAVGLVIVLLLVGLLSGGGGSSSKHPGAAARGTATTHGHRGTAQRTSTSAASTLVALHLEPSAPVYVCLIGDGRRRIPGLTLQPGAPEPTYHAQRFEITLGNNAVALTIDGTLRAVPSSSKPIGYSITKATGRRTLAASEQPTCK